MRSIHFDHLVAELVLCPQPQGRTIHDRQRLAIHLVGEQTLRLERVLEVLRVIRSAIE